MGMRDRVLCSSHYYFPEPKECNADDTWRSSSHGRGNALLLVTQLRRGFALKGGERDAVWMLYLLRCFTMHTRHNTALLAVEPGRGCKLNLWIQSNERNLLNQVTGKRGWRGSWLSLPLSSHSVHPSISGSTCGLNSLSGDLQQQQVYARQAIVIDR